MTKSILYFSLICTHYLTGVEETLYQTWKNREKLKKVLIHYLEYPENSSKCQAAVSLIDNMKWHLSTEQVVFPDSSLFEWLSRFDSLYTNMMLGISDSTLHSEYNRGGHWQYSYVARQKVKYIFNVFTLKQDLLVFHKNAKFQMDNFRAYHKHFPSFFKRGRI